MITTEEPKPRVIQFPEAEITKALTEFWNKKLRERADDPFAAQVKGTLYDLLPALDSLTVVRSLVVVGKVLKMKIPVYLVQRGGYASRQEMLNHLVPKLRKHFEKRNSKP